jgi:hypothetical protein
MRVPKRTGRSSTASSVVNSYISSDIHPANLSRSSSVSFDNPSIDGSSLNDENQIPNSRPITTDSPLLQSITTPGLSSSLSELDPMLNSRPRTPSPTIVDEQIMMIPTDDNTVDQTLILEKQPSIVIEESINVSEPNEHSVLSSPSPSIDLSVERKNDDLLQITQEDSLDLM